MTHLYLIRHGDYIVGGKEGEYVDQGLSSLGVSQAEKLRDRLATGEILADVLISSTMPRARETAAILAPALGLPIVFDKEVEEWRNEDGTLSPEQFVAMWQAVPRDEKPFFRWVPSGENWMEFWMRVSTALNRILREHDGETIVIVCHGNVIEASFMYFFGLSTLNLRRATVDSHHTSITHWYCFPPAEDGTSTWILERHNDQAHLS